MLGKIKGAKASFSSSSLGKSHTSTDADAIQRRKDFASYCYTLGLTTSSTSEADYSSDDGLIDVLTPRAKKNVDRITFWVLQWPIVILSTFWEAVIRMNPIKKQ